MKKLLYKIKAFFINIFYALFGSLIFNGSPRVLNKDWLVTFVEDFDGPDLDKEKWMTQYYWGRTVPTTGALHYFSDGANHKQANSVLYLKAEEKETMGYKYTSGMIQTGFGVNKWIPYLKPVTDFTQKYGYFEIRCRMPKGKGLWPAFWMLTPLSVLPEIDIFEYRGSKPKQIVFTQHWGEAYDKNKGYDHNTSGRRRVVDLSKKFHTIGFEWSPTKLTWFVDGVKMFESTEHIPTEPMHIIAGLAVGGNYDGTPNEETKFPAFFEIDYIKVYQNKNYN